MKQELQFEFTADTAAQKVFVTRQFNAGLDMVWEAFTNKDLLDQWWAPAPMRSVTKYMNFEAGGRRFYAMVAPDGKENWAIQEYRSISPKTHFSMFNVFADKDENPQPHGSDWDHYFSEENGITTVRIEIYNESLERMQLILEGFRMGFTTALTNLEELLAGPMKK